MKKNIWLLLVLAISISGCGFKLKGQAPRKAILTRINYESSQHDLFDRALYKQLSIKKLQLLPNGHEPKLLQLKVPILHFETKTLAYGANTQTASASVVLTLMYELRDPTTQHLISQTINVTRDYVSSSQSVVQWEAELALIHHLLYQEAAAQIASRISRITP